MCYWLVLVYSPLVMTKLMTTVVEWCCIAGKEGGIGIHLFHNMCCYSNIHRTCFHEKFWVLNGSFGPPMSRCIDTYMHIIFHNLYSLQWVYKACWSWRTVVVWPKPVALQHLGFTSKVYIYIIYIHIGERANLSPELGFRCSQFDQIGFVPYEQWRIWIWECMTIRQIWPLY